jgi:ABC-2 type transport system ATP-binding protein
MTVRSSGPGSGGPELPLVQRHPEMLLEIDHLRLSLGGRLILSDVNLDLDAGEIYGILGPNGAGKSTTIGAVLGLLRPEAGSITMFGRSPGNDNSSARRRLGVLPERNGFYDWMPAPDYLRFFASLYGKRLTPPEVAAHLSKIGLAPRAGQSIATFSQGMRQRLGLARALIGDPDLIILDEPTSGLDPRGRREFHDMLLDLARNGAGILLCTHLLDDVDRLCQRVGIMVDGRTVAEGRIADLLRQSGQCSRFRLRLAGEHAEEHGAKGIASIIAREGEWLIVDIDVSATPDRVWRELMFRGWPITEIHREGGGLEDLYLSLTSAA